MTSGPDDPLLALTQGDPSGIGPDIALSAWLQRSGTSSPFVVIGDPVLLRARAGQLGFDVPVVEVEPSRARSCFPRALPVVPTGHTVQGGAGRPMPADAAGTIAAIEQGVQLVRSGLAGALVTNPIAKHVLYQAGFAHPGHTEFLAELAGRYWSMPVPLPVMMLWSEDLAVVPVTIHVPLAAVPGLLTRDLIRQTATIVAGDLRRRFGMASPRLACAGLNPHAGEDGSMGREEQDLIGPVLDQLRIEGFDIAGPLPADTLFTPAARARYDVALAMYHDQALIPIKTLAFDEAVNVTLGLPFIRTSPDHGTAFDIAGSGKARPTSLLAALGLAARLARHAADGSNG